MKIYQKIVVLLIAAHLVGCESGPEPTLYGTDMTVIEGNANTTISFEVSLNAPPPKQVSFDYNTVDISALENVDYVPTSGTATIAKGEPPPNKY